MRFANGRRWTSQEPPFSSLLPCPNPCPPSEIHSYLGLEISPPAKTQKYVDFLSQHSPCSTLTCPTPSYPSPDWPRPAQSHLPFLSNCIQVFPRDFAPAPLPQILQSLSISISLFLFLSLSMENIQISLKLPNWIIARENFEIFEDGRPKQTWSKSPHWPAFKLTKKVILHNNQNTFSHPPSNHTFKEDQVSTTSMMTWVRQPTAVFVRKPVLILTIPPMIRWPGTRQPPSTVRGSPTPSLSTGGTRSRMHDDYYNDYFSLSLIHFFLCHTFRFQMHFFNDKKQST